MSLALSTCVLLISLMQLVNGGKFLNIFLLVIFASASAATVLLTVIVPLTRIYVSP